jgi:3-oxoacyl-[acyl-carrier-protein] synthase-3
MSKPQTTMGRRIVSTGRRRLLGVGSALPGVAITTQALCQYIQDQFGIKTARYASILAPRLGVKTRYLCRDFKEAIEAPRAGARNPELAAQAIQNAMNMANSSPDSLGYLISHTATPATLLPSGSAEIARLVGHTGAHLELRQACTGFANALQIAFAMTADPDSLPIAIVGVETGSVYFSPESLRTDNSQWINFLQMGDGAAAVIVGPDDQLQNDENKQNETMYISAAYFGQYQHPPEPGLSLRVGGSDQAFSQSGPILFEHDYSSVAEHGALLLDAGREVLSVAGHALEQAQFIVPHQASGAIAPWLAQRWNFPVERISTHAEKVGNLGSASIWAALHDVVQHRQKTRGKAYFLGAEATQYSYGGFVLDY